MASFCVRVINREGLLGQHSFTEFDVASLYLAVEKTSLDATLIEMWDEHDNVLIERWQLDDDTDWVLIHF